MPNHAAGASARVLKARGGRRLRSMSDLVALLQLRSVLMSGVPVPWKAMQTPKIEGHASILGPYRCWDSGEIQTQLLPRTLSGSTVVGL